MPLAALVFVCALFPRSSGCWPWWYARCPAGRFGSRWCGRCRSGPNARCRSAGFRGGGGRRPNRGPFLPLVRLGGVALLSTAIVLLGCSLTAIALEIGRWWQRSGPGNASGGTGDTPADLPRRWCCRVSASAWCCWPVSWCGRRCGIRVLDPVPTPPSPWPSSRAMFPAWARLQRSTS
ncbi:apolipoN-acyltransferase domain protein [Mycobacterium xenopi 3993]|nr:apolipoN-acyltransferase domain protein [Mycobacterium xenopi 3993]